ncbi:Acetolactate synthase 1 [Nymphaea thermarum]|nr:Acetolactate synthase 1 [Nymphaea thermarum]
MALKLLAQNLNILRCPHYNISRHLPFFQQSKFGMHDTIHENYAVDQADLLLAFGVKSNNMVIRELEAFASRTNIVHPRSRPHVSPHDDIWLALERLNKMLVEKGKVIRRLDFTTWRNELDEQKKNWPLGFLNFREAIPLQYAIKVLDKLTNGELMGLGIPTTISIAVSNPGSKVVDINGDVGRRTLQGQ